MDFKAWHKWISKTFWYVTHNIFSISNRRCKRKFCLKYDMKIFIAFAQNAHVYPYKNLSKFSEINGSIEWMVWPWIISLSGHPLIINKIRITYLWTVWRLLNLNLDHVVGISTEAWLSLVLGLIEFLEEIRPFK